VAISSTTYELSGFGDIPLTNLGAGSNIVPGDSLSIRFMVEVLTTTVQSNIGVASVTVYGTSTLQIVSASGMCPPGVCDVTTTCYQLCATSFATPNGAYLTRFRPDFNY